MAYFTKEYLKFFKDLSKNNNREWFHANKKRYEASVKKPFYEFTQVMIDKLSKLDDEINLTPKECVFRINRDIRFSKDKTPYKVQMSAAVSPGGRKDHSSPGLYYQFTPGEVGLYSGLYSLDTKQLQKVREHIAGNLKQFEKLLKGKKFIEKFGGEIHGEKNKRLPKELMDAAEQQPLLYNKQFYYFVNHKPEIILQDDLPKMLVEHYKAARPLSLFFKEALG